MNDMNKLTSSLLVVLMAFCMVACDSDDNATEVNNPHVYITDADKAAMLKSITNICNGELYEFNYTVDYKLDECLKTDMKTYSDMGQFILKNLMDVVPTTSVNLSFPSFGCSMYAATLTNPNEYVAGRNLDFCHTVNGVMTPTAAIIMHTAPKGGKRSVSLVDGLFMGVGKGFLNDGKSDLSMLMAAPYLTLDGINEDGLAAGVLFLDGNYGYQDDGGKNHIWGTTLMRLALDKASTVAEAEKLIRQYNVSMKPEAGNNSYHFMLADATGDYAIIECSYGQDQVVATDNPNVLHFFRGDQYRYVTNFYVDPRMANESIGGLSEHGRDRYNKLRDTLQVKSYHLTEAEAMDLLKNVSQAPDPNLPTSFTQWSSLYNLSRRTLELCILRDYDRRFTFSVR